MNSNDPSMGQIVAGAVIVGVVAITLLGTLFDGDRRTVNRCIDAMAEAARGGAIFGEMRQLRDEVAAADEIIITNRTDTPFGRETISNIDFTIDGRRSGLMCAI